MKQFSNLYIFCFSSALVLVVAAALSFTSLSLKPQQDTNIEIERQQNILAALGVETTTADVQAKYREYIRRGVVLKADGTEVSGQTPEGVDLKKENEKPAGERLLPLYMAEKDGHPYIVIPVRGAGLWGPIWGNVAVASDMNTVYGVTFDHKGETPGLGAEISTPGFQKPFGGKTLFDEANRFVSIKVEKPGTYTPDSHTVDAISGGTITSKALEAMIHNGLEPYQTYFSQHKSNQ
jgi:Na+-transporting NADH:ubiquinone oxidoreductase subunit C